MVITSVAGTISMGRFGEACRASSARTTLCWPTSRMRTPNSRAASTLPSTSGRGAWSPPMASTAMVIMGFCPQNQRNAKSLSRRLYRLALVVAAVRTHLVRLLHFMTIRAFGPRKLLFFQQVLFDACERSQAGIRGVGLAAALLVVQVGAAIWAQPPAVALANGLNGKRQQHLLFQHVRQEKAISLIKADICIVILQPVFPVFDEIGAFRKRRIKQVKDRK